MPTITEPGQTFTTEEVLTQPLVIDAPGVTVKRVKLKGANIVVLEDDYQIIDCDIQDFPGSAIHVDSSGSFQNWIRGGSIIANRIQGCKNGVQLEGHECEILRNSISDTRAYGGDHNGIIFFGSDITIRHNAFFGSLDANTAEHFDGIQSWIRDKGGANMERIAIDGNFFSALSQAMHWKAIDAGARYKDVSLNDNIFWPSNEAAGEKRTVKGIDIYDTDLIDFSNHTAYLLQYWAARFTNCDLLREDGRNVYADCGGYDFGGEIGSELLKEDFVSPAWRPTSWADIYGPDAGWRTGPDWALYGAQIPVMTDQLTGEVVEPDPQEAKYPFEVPMTYKGEKYWLPARRAQ